MQALGEGADSAMAVVSWCRGSDGCAAKATRSPHKGSTCAVRFRQLTLLCLLATLAQVCSGQMQDPLKGQVSEARAAARGLDVRCRLV